MSDNDNFLLFKDDMNRNFDELKTDIKDLIKELTRNITTHQKETSEYKTQIAVLDTKFIMLEKAEDKRFKDLKDDTQQNLKDFKDDQEKISDKNSIQHEEFYTNFKNQDKFIFKLSGGLASAGLLITLAVKFFK